MYARAPDFHARLQRALWGQVHELMRPPGLEPRPAPKRDSPEQMVARRRKRKDAAGAHPWPKAGVSPGKAPPL